MKQPLEDIKVLDLSRVYAAPAGSMILADLGAKVIRVEHPLGSDNTREWSPFHNEKSTYYISANRNKQSITLDLKKKEGKEAFLKLVKQADVVLENFKTGTLERMGLHYEELKKVNNQLIMCSVTGYGQTGPYKGEPGFDPVIQAISGLMDVTGLKDGPATKVGIPIADILTAKYVAISILAAIRMRDFNEQGQYIDLSLLDVQMSNLANVSTGYLNTGFISERLGNEHNNVVPYQVFETKDKPIMISAGNDNLYKRFCDVIGKPELATDEKYAVNVNRLKNRESLINIISPIIKTKTADEWLQLFIDAKIPAGEVNSIPDAFNHPQVVARDMVEIMEHEVVGNIKMVKSPLRFSGLNVETKHAPPQLGEQNDEVFAEFGFTEKEIEALRRNNII